jgi:hypothetical protein
MVIWPKEVSRSDAGWQEVLALLEVLPLVARRPFPSRSAQCVRGDVECADELLVQPTITVDRRQVPAPYFQYRLAFGAAVSVHGAIAIDSVAELAEFRRVIDAALSRARAATASDADTVYGETYVSLGESHTKHEDVICALIARDRTRLNLQPMAA